jgi:hypothetical protein
MGAEFVLPLGFAYRSLGEGRGVPFPLFIVEYLGSSNRLLGGEGIEPTRIRIEMTLNKGNLMTYEGQDGGVGRITNCRNYG